MISRGTSISGNLHISIDISIVCLVEEPHAVVQQVGQGILQGTLGAGDEAQGSGQLLEPRPTTMEVWLCAVQSVET